MTNSTSKDGDPSKKVKRDNSDDEKLKKTKTEPKNTKSGDLSVSKDVKADTTIKEAVKEAAKEAVK